LELALRKDRKEDYGALFALLDKFYPKETSNFLKQQAVLLQKKIKGRRYSAEFKQYCLSLYFSSQKTYKQLSKLFCLPSGSIVLYGSLLKSVTYIQDCKITYLNF